METMTSIWGQFEVNAGLKQGTMASLHAEQSDWARVIKAYGIAEAAVNVRLARRFSDLAEIVTRLPFDHRIYGKLAILRTVKWLQDYEARFLRVLHQLRSTLVHNVGYLDFDLNEDTARWSSKQRDPFVDAVFEFWHSSTKSDLDAEWRLAEKAEIRPLLFAATFRFLYDTGD